MKVAIHETLEVSDEELSQIADLIDGESTPRKAKRDEARTFIWNRGSTWRGWLDDQWQERFGLDLI